MLVKTIRKTPLALAVSTALFVATQGAAFAYESPVHVFSVNDVQGGFDGSTFGGTAGITADDSIICDLGSVGCPTGNGPVVDKQGVTLYPVDSEFGYHVVDFLGAQGKARDGDYKEGFVGNILVEGVQAGIKVANAPTLKYKVKPPLGTWCQGLGGTAVKCETEHYVVMEHVQSCYETIPYSFATVVGDIATQAVLTTPDMTLEYDCAFAGLDDDVQVLVSGVEAERLINPTPCESGTPGIDELPEGCQMFPNDKTDMQNNIALSDDYSVQLKDDGKPLYGWGGIHKRPNDVRMYARLALPAEWKEPETDFTVIKAQLVVNHWITNNPNDQLRPEDLENEAATGRKPSYTIEGEIGGADEVWKSTKTCYEGDGDLIDTEEGAVDPTFIGIGTVLKNANFALDKTATPGNLPSDDPYAFSSDLYGGFTNAFYTTLDREPFEWAYDANPDPRIQDFVSSPVPNELLGEFISGPRWRLKPGKFGQDLPAMEIPLVECSKPPFKSDNIKYDVGTPTTTIINLLDWDEVANGPSPLATSAGWVDYNQNPFITVNQAGISSNGIPMSDDFDLAVYIKGDAKSTALFDAKLIIEYAGETFNTAPVANDDPDVAAIIVACDDISAPIDVLANDTDADGDTLFVDGFTNGTFGSVDQVLESNLLTYTSDGTCPARDSFTYTVSDGNGGTDTATVTVSVGSPATLAYDMDIVEPLGVPATARLFTWQNSTVTVENVGTLPISGNATVVGTGSVSGRSSTFTFSYTGLAAGESRTFDFRWYPYTIARYNIGSTINWTATVSSADDQNPANDTAEAITTITR